MEQPSATACLILLHCPCMKCFTMPLQVVHRVRQYRHIGIPKRVCLERSKSIFSAMTNVGMTLVNVLI